MKTNARIAALCLVGFLGFTTDTAPGEISTNERIAAAEAVVAASETMA